MRASPVVTLDETMLYVAVRQAAVALVGVRIRDARKAMRRRDGRAWLQKDLAHAVHVEPTTISRWERGATSPDIYMLERIAEATKKPLSFFVSGADAIPEPAAGESQVAQDRQEERAALLDAIRSLREVVDEQMVLIRLMAERLGVQETPARARITRGRQ